MFGEQARSVGLEAETWNSLLADVRCNSEGPTTIRSLEAPTKATAVSSGFYLASI